MLNEREIRRLHEIEVQLRLTDPRLVRRMGSLNSALRSAPRRDGRLPAGAHGRAHRSVHGAGPIPALLLGAALVVLLIGAIAVNVPIVVAGIVVAGLALGAAATAGPQTRPGTA